MNLFDKYYYENYRIEFKQKLELHTSSLYDCIAIMIIRQTDKHTNTYVYIYMHI